MKPPTPLPPRIPRQIAPGDFPEGVRGALAGPAVDLEVDAGMTPEPDLQRGGALDGGVIGGALCGVADHQRGGVGQIGLVGEAEVLLLDQPAQEGRGAALGVHGGVGVLAVGDELAVLVMVGKAPQVGAGLAALAVAHAVVALQLVEGAGEAPVLPLVQLLEAQGVVCALLEGIWRFRGLRAAGGDVDGACAERIAVVQVSDPEGGFAQVDGSDEVPRHAGAGADGCVRRHQGQRLGAQFVDRPGALGADLQGIEQLAVFVAKLLTRLAHALAPGFEASPTTVAPGLGTLRRRSPWMIRPGTASKNSAMLASLTQQAISASTPKPLVKIPGAPTANGCCARDVGTQASAAACW